MFWEGRRLRFLIGILSLALFLLGFERMAALEPAREKGTLPTRPPTPYIHYLPGSETHRRALVVPGLDSNKEFMQILSSALADEGIEAYAIDLPGHGDSPVGFNGVLATSTLEQVVSALNPDIAIALGTMVMGPDDKAIGQLVELLACRHPTADEMGAYERLLGEAMKGDATLFARQDYVEDAWRIVDPVLGTVSPVFEYEPHTWGPAQADVVGADVGGWHNPKPTPC